MPVSTVFKQGSRNSTRTGAIALTCSFSLFPNSSALAEKQASALTPQEICQRLEVLNDVYVTVSKGGGLINKMASERKIRFVGSDGEDESPKKDAGPAVCRSQSRWSSHSSAFDGALLLDVDVSVLPSGALAAKIRQYAETPSKTDPKRADYGKLIAEENFAFPDMGAAIFVSKLHTKERVIVRLVPRIAEDESPRDVGDLPLALEHGHIVDNKGNAWARNIGFEGKYVGITTAQGALMLSYYPFAGAKVLGFARGSEIVLQPKPGLVLQMSSSTPLLGSGQSNKVYGIYIPEKKTDSHSKQGVFSLGKEQDFLKRMRE